MTLIQDGPMIDVEKLIKELQEAILCDPDEGDPYLCLDEVDFIINKLMKGTYYESK